MLLRKFFARKTVRPTPRPAAKPGNLEVGLNPFALLVKGASRF
jgi:hypothetical protein